MKNLQISPLRIVRCFNWNEKLSMDVRTSIWNGEEPAPYPSISTNMFEVSTQVVVDQPRTFLMPDGLYIRLGLRFHHWDRLSTASERGGA